MNIYVLSYNVTGLDKHPRIATFTNKSAAIKAGQYYRDSLKYHYVYIRHDKQSANGWCTIIGFIHF